MVVDSRLYVVRPSVCKGNFVMIVRASFQVVKGSEILEILHSLPDIRNYLFSLYNCHYSDFFRSLGE